MSINKSRHEMLQTLFTRLCFLGAVYIGLLPFMGVLDGLLMMGLMAAFVAAIVVLLYPFMFFICVYELGLYTSWHILNPARYIVSLTMYALFGAVVDY